LSILLSSFNGSKFIAEQINSIRQQTYRRWTLLVRDDGSSDHTIAIVESLAAQDSRIALLRDSKGNLGPAASFGVLLQQAQQSGAPYVALADQDDVWLPTKLARELELLQQEERAAGTATPLLVHSDLAVVREDLTLLHRSFLEFQGIRHRSESALATLLIQNFVTGSTVVLNRALLDAAVPLPPVIMHDWWLALCAAALGRLLYVPEATVLYRQHGRNAQGSRGTWAGVRDAMRRPLTWWAGSAALLDRAVEQARELAQRIEQPSPAVSPAAAMLRDFCAAFEPRSSAVNRLRVVYHHRIQPRSFLPYPVPFYARVLLWDGDLRRQRAALPSGPEEEAQRGAPVRSRL
jgi:glycosyltransferase involved in cell wall biosynthesis